MFEMDLQQGNYIDDNTLHTENLCIKCVMHILPLNRYASAQPTKRLFSTVKAANHLNVKTSCH